MNLLREKIASCLSLQIQLDYLIFLLGGGVDKLSGDAFFFYKKKIGGKWLKISLKELHSKVIFR